MAQISQRKRISFGIGAKVNAVILATLIVGFGAVISYFGWSLVATRGELTRSTLEQETDILAASIENFMIPGEAPIAVAYFDEIAQRNPDFEIALYRRDGSGAFSDGTTAAGVNQRIGGTRFPLDLKRPVFPPPDSAGMGPATSLPPSNVQIEKDSSMADGRKARVISVYRPLINLPKCVGCHGGDHTIRGVVRVSANVTESMNAQRAAIGISSGLFVAIVGLVGAVLARFMRRTVVSPVKAIGELCARVADGDFSGRVEHPVADEIGNLADTVNMMTLGLRERSELSKYVSGSTISAIRGSQSSLRDRRTLLFSDIRGFTSFSEKYPAETVVEALNAALDAQSRIVAEQGGDVDKFVGDEVMAVFSGEKAEENACAAALLMHRALRSVSSAEPLQIGIGIATGDVIHGMIGSQTRADFTVIGDAVNTAARLCSAAKGGMTLVHSSAAHNLKGKGGFTLKGPYGMGLKGKKDRQAVFVLEEGGKDA